jgi:hypothetical protein
VGRVISDGAVTFGQFVRNRFFPLKEAQGGPETAKVNKLIIQKDLIDSFDGITGKNTHAAALLETAPSSLALTALHRPTFQVRKASTQ